MKILTQIVDIASITERIRSVGLRARKEEDVRIGVEKILDEVIRSFELQPAFYEYTFVAGGRADALYGYLIIHNYIREHEGLKGKTPAEVCGITIEGKNKWMTLIQNASKARKG